MNYLNLASKLKINKLCLFGLQDIRNLFAAEKLKTIKNNISRWVAKGYLVRLKRDVYELADAVKDSKIPDLYIANKLYEPSYVSLETALSIYSIIPDIAAGVTSVTIRPTRIFRNKYGSFFYRTCKRNAFAGYRLTLYEGLKVYIADQEKALVDFLYYRLRLSSILDFNQERLNKRILKKISWKKALNYAKFFDAKTIKTLKACREYVKC